MKKSFCIVAFTLSAAIAMVLASCSSGYSQPQTTTQTTTSANNYVTTGSNSGGGSYNSYDSDDSYGYDEDDDYYRNNDYNNDGELNGNEFQGAVNDYMDDYFAAYGY